MSDWAADLGIGGRSGGLPQGYRREGRIVGRAELFEGDGRGLWREGEFVARAEAPNTTSAVEARIRRRTLERLVADHGFDRSAPALEIGCGDGLVTRQLLDLGFERLVSSDISLPSLAKLEAGLDDAERERIALVVDDILLLPFDRGSFATVIAWGVLSVTPDLGRALELSWKWLAPGGCLLLAEPVLESVLAYTLVRGDLAEFRRTLAEGTRAARWEDREERYRVHRHAFYLERIADLPNAELVAEGGISMLPSLALGGVAQDETLGADELAEISELLGDEEVEELRLWRQCWWLLRKGASSR